MRSTAYLALLILIINIYRVRSGAFVYGLYDDTIYASFIARKSAFIFADPIISPLNVVNLYSVPTSSYLTLQFLAENIDGMPLSPNNTLSPDRGIDKPNANLYTSIGVSMPKNLFALVLSNINTGIAITFCYPDPNNTISNPMAIQDFDYIYWNDTMFSNSDSTYPNDGANSQIVSIARSSQPDTFETIPAVLYHTQQHIFRVLLMKVDYSVGYLSMIKVLFSPPNVVCGRPAVVSYESRFFNSYIFAYAYQTGAFTWSLLVQTFDELGTVNNVTEYTIPSSQKPIDIEMTYVEYDVVAITYQLVSGTRTSLRQATINVYAQAFTENEVTAVESTSATYAFATNVIPASKLITIWSLSTDTTIFNGIIFDSLNASNPPVQFSVPAADPSQAISRLIVAPFSSDSFAITQVYTTSPASFTNYYTLSSCDGTSGLKEPVDCSQNNYACSCSCDSKAGYYNASDGISCYTVCGDNIVAGNETCDNTNDTNCISCTCVQNFVWSTTDLLCVRQTVVPNAGTTPTSSPTDNNTPAANTTPASGWNNDYIAAIVLCTAAAGAAIFLGVYFGKKRKAGQKKLKKPESDQDQQPQVLSDKEHTTGANNGQMATSATGSYIGLPKPEEIELQSSSNVIARNNSNVTATSAADKLNVPYGELKFITEIGAGAYGKVFIGEWQRVKVALKINTSATGADFEREAKLMVELRPHPNVVQMLGVSSDGPYPVMILEYCDGGSLDSKVFDKSKEWTVADQLRTVTGIAKGLYHLHRNQIVHRDISARNILMNFGQPKISDFGMSRFVDDTKKGSTTKSNVGPIRWMSPESLKYQSYSTKSDVWTFGLVIYEIVARQEPHEDADQIAIGLQIRDQGATPVIPEGCDPCLKEIMQKCWQMDPESRPTMEDICDILDTYLENKKL